MALAWFPDSFDLAVHQRASGVHLDTVLTALADLQHGTLTARQLLATGVTRTQIRNRVRTRHLTPLGAGVYCVGRSGPTLAGRRMAAVLAAGPGAVLADLCAASHLGADVPLLPAVQVIVPTGRRIVRPGIRVRDARVLAGERRIVDGIPCLTWPRVLLDVSAHRGRRRLEDLWHQGVYRRRIRVPEIRAVLHQHAGERGVAALRTLLERREGAIGAAANRLEAEMRQLVLEAGMPEPRSNLPLYAGGVRLRPDLYLPERRLAFETDGREGHEDPEQQRDDAQRDALYRSLGVTVCRYGWWAVHYERARVLGELVRFECAWRRTGGRWSAVDPAPRFALSRRPSAAGLRAAA